MRRETKHMSSTCEKKWLNAIEALLVSMEDGVKPMVRTIRLEVG